MATKAAIKAATKSSSSTTAPKKRMTQSEIMNYFAGKFEMKRAQVKEVFDELADLATRQVKTNEEFTIPGFGKLVLARRKARGAKSGDRRGDPDRSEDDA